ncbi:MULTISPECIES: ATP-binding protein [unclassified Lentimonas]|uniref:ATP-binding protein n=1 Tax=unclassified Lentimonas TaxID=2630993 RepID=UPI00132B9C09|nr:MULTISPECIES: ATP-binding protein [unclassified Lentimonas]CAA6689494.1 Unannotated [Lentimonas sp. CC19]CAA6692512.1 Unannotated [Lentimonas sp. CC10]CAA7069151.1 Unannotated [Lentimonas sp. CC11]
MRRLHILLIATLLTGALAAIAADGSQEAAPVELSLSQLEQRLTDIDAALSSLAPTTMRSGVGAVGYQSAAHIEANHTEWVQIDLGAEFPIDQIVLVPTIARDPENGLQASGFPLEFRILAGTANTNRVLASFTVEDGLLPRIAPVTIPVDHLAASWIRLEATLLSPRSWANQRHALKLSEMMVFSGKRNVALQKPVEASSSFRSNSGRHERYLVDGFIPYLMDAAHGEKSAARSLGINRKVGDRSLTIDLGAPTMVNQINLHAVDLSRTVPEAATNDYAFPRRLRITGANDPDFAEQTLLFEYERASIYDAGPITMRSFPETRCRYVRMTVLEDPTSTDLENKKARIGFAEIEILSDGENKALGQPVTAGDGLQDTELTLQRMTDGRNFYGDILPTRDWMNQLARRHELESERPRVMAELTHRYERQKTTLKLATWIIALLLGGGIVLVLIQQILRQRAVFKTRERIAANLHDELGANLHAIGLLGDTVQKVVEQKNASEEWSDLIEIVGDIRELTEETGATARFCTNMLEADGIYQNLVNDMKRMADRLLADLNHDFSILNGHRLNRFQANRRIDLMLFYKESLTNIIRHSNATAVSTTLSIEKKEIFLSICDNGRGTQGQVPPSLKRRARLLGGNVTAESTVDGGTCITIRFCPRRKFLAWRIPELKS